MYPFLALVIIAFILLTAESWALRRCVKKIPLRILVNGTRGKSSVTKYVAQGLRVADRKTICKITGIVPTIIYPDGSEKIIKRIGPARVQEQFKMIRLASKLNADCLVLECMSLSPELQKLESRVFKPNIYVITNIKDDHHEQMGEKTEQVKAICEAIPSNTILVTAEIKYLKEIITSAKSKNSSLTFIEDSGSKSSGIPNDPFTANIKLALEVCKTANVENVKTEKAILEMMKSDENSLVEFNLAGKKIRFINGFAVNDVPSAEEFMRFWQNRLESFHKLNIIFNSRADRPLRTVVFAKWLSTIKNANKIILIGDHVNRAKIELVRNGFESQKIITWTKSKIKNAAGYIKKNAEPESVFIGLGNIAGEGMMVLDSFKREHMIERINDN